MSINPRENEKGFVCVKGTAGIGNRIHALLTAILYCKLTHRTLIVDWRDEFYSNGSLNIFDELFTLNDIPYSSDLSKLKDFNSIHPHIWGNRETLTLDSLRRQDPLILAGYDSKISRCQSMFQRYSTDLRQSKYDQQLLIYSSYTDEIDKLRSLLKENSLDLHEKSSKALLAELYHCHLRLSSRIVGRAEKFMEKHFTDRDVLGVHIRQSDLSISLEKYFKSIDEVIYQKPGSWIFLATDNSEVEADFIEKYQQVITYPKWFPPPGERMHRNKQCPSLLNHATDSLTELHILSKCSSIIFSGQSSFGKVAVLMSNLPPSQCLDVDNFSNNQTSIPWDFNTFKTILRNKRTKMIMKISEFIDLSRLPKVVNQIILKII